MTGTRHSSEVSGVSNLVDVEFYSPESPYAGIRGTRSYNSNGGTAS